MKRTRTFTVTYNYFKPGTYVVSARKPMTTPRRVDACLEPELPGEPCVALLEGWPDHIDTEYLREVITEKFVEGMPVYTNKLEVACHYCPFCGGWVEGEPFRNKPILSGREGVVEYCQRCEQEIDFIGAP